MDIYKLRSGAVIAPHLGTYGRLVASLDLEMPGPEAGSRAVVSCDGEMRHWEDGKFLVFDDSFDHHVELGCDDG